MTTQRILIATLAAIAGAIPASATLTTCTTQSCLSIPTDTFSNISFAAGSLGTSTTESDVVFSTSGAGLTGEANPTGWPTGSAEPALAAPGLITLTITLPSNVNAIEFAAGLLDFSQLQFSITDNAGGTYTNGGLYQSNVDVPVYFGVSTTGSFSTFTISSITTGDRLTLDDIQIGQAETPEAATLLLVGTGLLAMGYFRRRRNRPAENAAGSRHSAVNLAGQQVHAV